MRHTVPIIPPSHSVAQVKDEVGMTVANNNNDNRFTLQRRHTVSIIPPLQSAAQVKEGVNTIAELNTVKGSRNGSSTNIVIKKEKQGHVMGFRPIQCGNGSTKNRSIIKEQQGQVIDSHTVLKKQDVEIIPASSTYCSSKKSSIGCKRVAERFEKERTYDSNLAMETGSSDCSRR
jgi:hypothetical protein